MAFDEGLYAWVQEALEPMGSVSKRPMMGAAVLTVSDWAAQRALSTQDIPVGVVTAALGGAYLCWLLFREHRTRSV